MWYRLAKHLVFSEFQNYRDILTGKVPSPSYSNPATEIPTEIPTPVSPEPAPLPVSVPSMPQSPAPTASPSQDTETVDLNASEGITGDYWIPEYKLEKLSVGFEKLNKQMVKLTGLYPNESFQPATYKIIGRESRKLPLNVNPEDYADMFDVGFEHTIPYCHVQVEGSAPKLNGWTFIARILHGADDNGQPLNTFLGVPGKEMPKKYRNAYPNCEHCNQNRNRKDTFILHHDEHGHKQVGKSCLADFLGNSNPEALAASLTYLDEIRRHLADDGMQGQGSHAHIDVTKFDTFATFIADKFGYTSAAKADEKGILSTKQILEGLIDPENASPFVKEAMGPYVNAWKSLSEEEQTHYETMSHEAIERAKAFKDDDQVSDFNWNLAAAAHGSSVDPRKMGLRAYIPADMLRERKKQEELQAKQDAEKEQYSGETVDYGEPGNAFVTPVTLIGLRGINSQYGLTLLHKFKDASGQELSWFASGGVELGDIGDTFTIRGKIKKYDSYQGRSQIVVTNVKMVDPSEMDANGNLLKKKKPSKKDMAV